MEAQEVHSKKAAEGAWRGSSCVSSTFMSLPDAKKTDAEKTAEEEAQILAAIASRKKLASDMELAKGIQYTEALKTTFVRIFISLTMPFTHSQQLETTQVYTRYSSGRDPKNTRQVSHRCGG